MTQSIRVMQYQVVKPCNCDWAIFGKLLSHLQSATRQVLNKTIQLCWEWQGFGSDYYKKFGKGASDKELLGYSLSGFCYHQLRQQYPFIHSSNISQSIQKAILRWKSDATDILHGTKSIPWYKRGTAIDLHKDTIKLKRTSDGRYIVQMSLLSLVGRKEFGLTGRTIDAVVNVADNKQREIFDRILTGEYSIGACQLVCAKRKWFLQLRYKFECTQESLNTQNVAGVRLGIESPIYIVFSNSMKRAYVGSDEVDAFRKRLVARYANILSTSQATGKGRRGHGKTKRLETIWSIRHKISHFRHSMNHKYSRFIVEQAVQHECGTIQIESPKIILRKNRSLGNWSYFDLMQKLEYKANERGIHVNYVTNRDCEKRCSNCGRLNSAVDAASTVFSCSFCGFTVAADENAAQNLVAVTKIAANTD